MIVEAIKPDGRVLHWDPETRDWVPFEHDGSPISTLAQDIAKRGYIVRLYHGDYPVVVVERSGFILFATSWGLSRPLTHADVPGVVDELLMRWTMGYERSVAAMAPGTRKDSKVSCGEALK